MIVDLRGAPVQKQEVVYAIQSIALSGTAEKVAFVAATALARLQANRLQVRDNVRAFSDIDEAEAWVLDSAPQAPCDT